MRCDTLLFVSIPGLRLRDLAHMPRLKALADRGAAAEITPTFPCVTSPVQMNMLTGRTPQEHGIIGNGFYHRERGEVELWVGRNGLVQCEQLWDVLARRGIKSAAWMTQNIKDAAADFIVTPEPKHRPDGGVDLWCYAKPDGLYQRLASDLGHFPLMNYWGPMSSIKSTEWIINGALWLLQRERPRFNYIYIPHLDYAGQKFGPNSPQAAAACREADEQLGRLFDGVEALRAGRPHSPLGNVGWLIVSEYAMTDVSRVIYPNRILRDARLANVVTGGRGSRRADSGVGPVSSRSSVSPADPGGRGSRRADSGVGPGSGVGPVSNRSSESPAPAEYLDIPGSLAFAVVDHQFAHVYVKDPTDIDGVAGLFEGLPGIAEVLTGRDRARRHLDHPRSGEVVLICRPDTWLAYYWWHDDALSPPFARTVDIHAKPGYDPVELFFDPATKSIPLNASLVKGSHGAPAETPDQRGVIVTSDAGLLSNGPLRDLDVFGLLTN